jgi:hypothetical protein
VSSNDPKFDKLIRLRATAEADVERVKKILKNDPDNKGLQNCLNQAIDTVQACNLFIRIFTDMEDDLCWSLNCDYYNNNDHYIKSDGSINKWCYGCCQKIEVEIDNEEGEPPCKSQ